MRRRGMTDYSASLAGNARNHNLPARFDLTDGFLGISQLEDRVLLTPAQVEALIAFIRPPRKKATR